jgi:hypothetical protein
MLKFLFKSKAILRWVKKEESTDKASENVKSIEEIL